MEIKTVFIDMDMVLCDFCKGAIDLLPLEGQPMDEITHIRDQVEGGYNYIHDYFGSNTKMHNALEKDLDNFWLNLPKFKWADQLVAMASNSGKEIYLLTSVHPRHYTWSVGKMLWVKKNYPKLLKKLIVMEFKHLVAAPDRLLIDDSKTNVKKFEKFGGNAILWPMWYNRDMDVSEVPDDEWTAGQMHERMVDVAINKIDEILKGE